MNDICNALILSLDNNIWTIFVKKWAGSFLYHLEQFWVISSQHFDLKRPNIGTYRQNLGIAYDIHDKEVKLFGKVVLIASSSHGTWFWSFRPNLVQFMAKIDQILIREGNIWIFLCKIHTQGLKYIPNSNNQVEPLFATFY